MTLSILLSMIESAPSVNLSECDAVRHACKERIFKLCQNSIFIIQQ